MGKKISFLFSIFFFIGCLKSGVTEYNPGNTLILYGNDFISKGGKLVILDLENNIEYNIPVPEFNAKYKFFYSNKKLLVAPMGGLHGQYEIMDFTVNKKKIFHSRNNLNGWTNFFDVYKDSLLIFSNYRDVFYETINTKGIDSISLNSEIIMDIICNKNRVVAISYNEADNKSDRINDPIILLFANLKNKKIKKVETKTSFILDWSPDGGNLIIADSSIKILKYPELTVTYINGMDTDSVTAIANLKYLNDSLIVFVGDNLKKAHGDEQLYLYNLNQKKIIKQLTTCTGAKNIFDVYNQKAN